MLAGEIHDLCYFGLCDLVGKDPTFPDPVMVNVQHDLGRGLAVLVEEALQYVDYELHRRVVVIEDQHAVEARPLRLRLGLGDDRRAGAVVTATAAALVIVRQTGAEAGERGGR